ncbi:MAG: 3-oxoadipate enol-lactonase [Hyphomicrobiales bacterium]|nr:3-oxoadipate enol-lactonase [Hyphomicrobiales bacterium]OQW80978.1 MAG: 3-oxoadipate enol-lactonase [Proteobacteria bacterium ST_bin15]
MPVIKIANGTELFFDLTGPADAPVVAFSNSLGTTLEMWDGQAEALARRYRVLRYDTRGHGRSQLIDQPTSLDDLADDLAGLLAALHIDKAHIVGLSLGGMTGQTMGFRHPARVSSLTLMATAAIMPDTQLWNQRIEQSRGKGCGSLVDGVMARWFTARTIRDHPDLVAPVKQRFAAISGIGYAVCCQAIRDMDLRAHLPRIAAPTLVISGADDPATPVADGSAIAALIPGAEFVVIPNAAHLLNIEQKAIVNRHLIAWLDLQAGSPPAAPGGVSFEAGLANRKSVLGAEYVERALDRAGAYGRPFQDFITRIAWGEIWGDPTLPRKTRSLLVLAITLALNREEEFKLHLRPAIETNGVTMEELRALLMQSAIYAGVPAANSAMRWVRDVLGDKIAEA